MSRRSKRRSGATPSATPPATRLAPVLWLAGILLATLVVYLPSLDNEFTDWDDTQYVTQNPLLDHPSLTALLNTPVGGNHHPLTMLTLAWNYQMSGLDPVSYHWTNLLLHLASTALVFGFVWMLSGGRRWTTIVCSLFFGIHPTHVESVAWIAERKDVLYAFFYLAGLIAYLRYLDARGAGRGAWWGAAFVTFVLSAASKPAAVVFPVTLLAIDWFRGRKPARGVWLEKVPFFAVAIAVGLITLQIQTASGALEKQWGWWTRVLSLSYGIVMYLVKLALPTHLSAIYPFPNVEGHAPGAEFYVTFAVAVVGIPLALYFVRRARHALFGVAFFFINIVLVLQFVAVGMAVMADRYTYLPYLGLFFALAWPLDDRVEKGTPAAVARTVVATGFLALAGFSLVQTYRRCDVWQNSGTLWDDTIRKYPNRIPDAYVNRGYYYQHSVKRFDAALEDYDRAIALNARIPNAWNNRGTLLSEMGRPDSALASYDRALNLKPDFPSALNNRGSVRLTAGRAAEGVADLSRAIALLPGFRDAYANRAIGYNLLGDHERAAADSRRAIELAPRHPSAYLYQGLLGYSLKSLERYREAIEPLSEAIRLSPAGESRLGAYYLQRSECWARLGDQAKAEADAREAKRLATAGG